MKVRLTPNGDTSAQRASRPRVVGAGTGEGRDRGPDAQWRDQGLPRRLCREGRAGCI